MHLLIVTIFLFHSSHNKETNSITLLSEKNALQAYVYHTKPHQTENKKIKPIQKHIAKISTDVKTLDNDYDENNDRQAAAKASNKPSDKFLTILHNAIQAHQHYPRKAQIMQRKGTALISFNLFPDGHIENVLLAASSGTDSLDDAAVLAVNEAAPFKEAALYLQNKKTFTVYVDFL